MGSPFDLEWIGDHLGDIIGKLIEHVELTAIAVVIGFLIAFPLGVLAFRHRRLYPPITWFTGVLYTIPSLAAFVLLIPFLGIGITNIEVALVSYTLLILIRNVVAGLDGVSEDAKDAARGMGLTRRQILWRVEIPLALPVIVAGIRIAIVTTIGLITVSALLGYGGLGFYILQGFQQYFATPIILGAVLSALLAIAADGAMLLAERWLTPWRRAGRKQAEA
jgi:osmoprotectant transport system permease protein